MNKHLTNIKNTEIIDITGYNLFEAARIIIKGSTEKSYISANRDLKYKTSIPNLENVLKTIPLMGKVEVV